MSGSSPIRRSAISILGLVLLLVLLLVAGRIGMDRAFGRVVSPHGEAMGSDQVHPNRTASPGPVDEPVPPPVTSLHVWVRAINEARYTKNWPPVAFEAVWPSADDSSWQLQRFEGLATAEGLRALSDPRFDYDDPPPDLLAAASEEGFAGGASNVSTPEAALLSLYATWVESDTTFDEQWGTFVGSHLPEDESWETVGQEGRDRIRGLPDYPSQDLQTLRDLAYEVLEKWPGHPVADHARFALLRSAIPRGREPDSVLVEEVLQTIESPRIREQGAIYLTRSLERVEPSVLAALDDVQATSVFNELRLSTWALNSAVRLEDWDRALTWSQRLRTTLDRECAVAEPDRRLHCETRQYELRDASARLVALGLATPRTWQEAMTAAAWRCHLEVAEHTGTSRTIATWSADGWTFAPWDSPTEATRCLSQVRRTEVAPTEPTQVRLTLEGPSG